jgi:hypothetical protein
MKSLIRKLKISAACALVLAALDPLVAHAQGLGTSLGPNQYNLTIGTGASMAAIGANPSRKGITICNGNATAANVITVTFGPSVTPVDGTTGVVIPGGQVAASCHTFPESGMGGVGNLGAQINIISHVGSNPVSAVEYY